MTPEQETSRKVAFTPLGYTVQAFAAVMQSKLAEPKNRHKGGWKGVDYGPFGDGRGHVWTESTEYLLRRLREEVDELEAALAGDDKDLIASEAADVGNFAMMIADVRWALP
jgi:hypothetical protein